MLWDSAKCSYEDWEQSYKRKHKKHNHQAGTEFKRAVQQTALSAVQALGHNQATFGDLRISSFSVNQSNDPGDDYQEI